MGMLKFTWPRIWRGGCLGKLLVIFNFFMVFLVKFTSIIVPLLLKEVIDAIKCPYDTESDRTAKKAGF